MLYSSPVNTHQALSLVNTINSSCHKVIVNNLILQIIVVNSILAGGPIAVNLYQTEPSLVIIYTYLLILAHPTKGIKNPLRNLENLNKND